jgi:hypothetical protein
MFGPASGAQVSPPSLDLSRPLTDWPKIRFCGLVESNTSARGNAGWLGGAMLRGVQVRPESVLRERNGGFWVITNTMPGTAGCDTTLTAVTVPKLDKLQLKAPSVLM